MPPPPPNEALYHAVGIGTSAYVRAAFRLELLRPDRAELPRGTLLVSTHRAETDAPLLIYAAYVTMGIWRDPTVRLSFAAREDLYEPGFFAGFPPGLPTPVRRLLYPLAIGRYLPLVRVYPIRSGHVLRVGQALRRLPPETPLPPALAEELGAATAGAALRGEIADRLWRPLRDGELDAAEVRAEWAAAAADDIRLLVELMRAGDPLLLFPEGRPSPDGEIGPLRRGVGLLVRRGRPREIRPVGLAYDPFVRGRTRAFVSFGEPFAPPGRDAEAAVLAALRLATPLTAASVAAHALLGGAATTDELADAVRAAVAAARAEGRNVERDLELAPLRRLSACLAALRRRGVIATDDGRRLTLLDPEPLRRFAREYESARSRE